MLNLKQFLTTISAVLKINIRVEVGRIHMFVNYKFFFSGLIFQAILFSLNIQKK